MSFTFLEIALPSGTENYGIEEQDRDGSTRLRPLEKVNVFVGANNSGKSRLLRALASTPILNAVPNLATFGLAAPFDSFRMELESFKGRVQSALMNNGGRDIQDIRRRIELLSITPQLSEGDPIVGQTIALVERMIALAEQSFAYTNDRAAAVHIAVLASEVVPKLFSNRDPSFSIPKTKKLEIVDDLNDGLI